MRKVVVPALVLVAALVAQPKPLPTTEAANHTVS